MSSNGISNNPFALEKANNNVCINKAVTIPHSFKDGFNAKDINFSNILAKDTLSFSSKETEETKELKEEIKTIKKQQGPIGMLWDKFKNITNIGRGSKKAEQAIKDFELGKINKEEMLKATEGYKKGQEQCIDIASDIISGIISFGAFSLSTGIGIAASPFTGGASLGLVAAGFGIAGVAGSASKALIKSVDCHIGGRKYKSFLYDIATGGVNGVSAPLTAGIGGAAGKAVATRLGVEAIHEGGEVVVKEAIKGTARGALTKTLLTTNVKYIGGTAAARALSLGTDLAVNGAISGAMDSGVRYAAGDNENKSVKGFAKEVATGTIGGLIVSPILGGGMRAIGNRAGKITNKLHTKVGTNYQKAKSAFLNVQTCENPDAETIRELGGIAKQISGLLDDSGIDHKKFVTKLMENMAPASKQVREVVTNVSDVSNEIAALSVKNQALIQEIEKELAEGGDISPKVRQLIEQCLTASDSMNGKINSSTREISEKLNTLGNDLTEMVASGKIDDETITQAINIASNARSTAKKIPNMQSVKELGTLPTKIESMCTSISKESAAIEEMEQRARAKIMSGNIEEGLADLKEYYIKVNTLSESLTEQAGKIQTTAERSGMGESTEILGNRLKKLFSSEKFKGLTEEERVQAIMEESNILFAKFAQTLSSEDSLPSEIQNVLKQFTSKGIQTRSLDEAQELANEIYGAGKYTLLKTFGAGTIGETYLAKTTDGQEVVIKMLKNGITPQKLKEDRQFFTRYINEFITDKADKEYKLNLINGMFDAWDKELDFALEAQGAKDLAENAKRFKVAQTIEIGAKNGQNISLVMEKADGIGLDELLEMIKCYKTNPTEYMNKYAEKIEKFPMLKNPDKWTQDLADAFQKAQNEQVMFIGKSGTRTIHADPHAGNVFVNLNGKKPQIVYIDAGNVVRRTNSQTLKDMCSSLNMIIGNSEGIAEAMLDGAILPEGATKEEMIKKFSQLLDERVFKAGVNIKTSGYTENAINGILKELNIVPNAGNSNLIKATLQRVETARAINNVCGTTSSKISNLKDIGIGLLKSLKVNPEETIKSIAPIVKWAYKNNDQAMITFFQMIMKKANIQNNIA